MTSVYIVRWSSGSSNSEALAAVAFLISLGEVEDPSLLSLYPLS